MGKLIKIVLLMAVIGGGIAIAYNLSDTEAEVEKMQAKDTEGGVEVQEKYGFAPIDTGL